MSIEERVAAHYGRSDLAAEILGALERAGKDLDRLRSQDLAAVDEFHICGAEATAKLADLLQLEPDLVLLDVGSGLGGASRHLAERFGCRVTGIDLTEEYCRCASDLADRIGLGERVEYHTGSALEMPFPDRHFDRAITQHVAMNIEDKPRLYGEVRRVLKPGGLFGIYDLLQGPGGDVHFPVPWARDASSSFLAAPDEMRRLLQHAGFEIVQWRDCSDDGHRWFQQMKERLDREGSPPLGFHLLMGPDFEEMAANQVRNLREQRILPTEIVCRISIWTARAPGAAVRWPIPASDAPPATRAATPARPRQDARPPATAASRPRGSRRRSTRPSAAT
jgi:ubiquinone/menaquinone biosynthesis C-methylase UbiE